MKDIKNKDLIEMYEEIEKYNKFLVESLENLEQKE